MRYTLSTMRFSRIGAPKLYGSQMANKLGYLPLIVLIFATLVYPAEPETDKGLRWVEISATKSSPAFRYQANLKEHTLQLRVQIPATSSLGNWVLHLWVADPRVVQERTATIAKLKESLQDYRDQIAGEDTNECQKTAMRAFLKDIREQIKKFEDYDPYLQWTVSGKETATIPSEIQLFSSQYTQNPEYSEYYVRVSLDQGFDLKNPKLTGVLLGVGLTAPDSSRLRPPHPSRIRFSVPIYPAAISKELQLQSRLAPDSILQYKQTGYSLAVLGLATELGCFGVEGVYNVPALWEKLELKNLSSEPAIRLYAYQDRLLAADRAHTELLDLKDHLTSNGYQDYELINLTRRAKHVYLFLKVSGPSRPLGGSSMCGAGEETDMIWLQLDQSLKIDKAQSENVESCFTDNDLIEQGDWTERSHWEATFDDLRDRTEKHLIYDSSHPDRGFQISTIPMKEQ